MKHKVELLAPAGNPEGFYGAIHAGADAVYLGGDRFGARAYADNFTTEEIIECIRYAHLWGRRVYLTVNTLVKENEFSELFPYLKPLYEAGLDGVIVQDYGVFCYIRKVFPEMELHVSTQMTITSKFGAEYLKQAGAKRIVLARELSLDEIKEIKAATGLSIETFIHGAMCYCYSGQCLFSSILGGRSGNRGRCAQPCRLPYSVDSPTKKTNECYPLSLKDMCTIEHLPRLIDAGIDSLKIEGRMKKPEYTAGVTAIYRKYLDLYGSKEAYKVSEKDLKALSQLYIRSEIQDGYYFRHNSPEMISLKDPSYGTTDDSLLSQIRSRYIEKRPHIPIQMYAEFKIGEPAILTLVSGNISVLAKGAEVSAALKQPITEENISKQLGKLGDTVFSADYIDITLEANCFYPLKALNELRRNAIQILEEELISANGLCVSRIAKEPEVTLTKSPETEDFDGNHMHILIRTTEQLTAVLDYFLQYTGDGNTFCPLNRLYLDFECARELLDTDKFHLLSKIEEYLSVNPHCQCIIALPQIIRKREEARLICLYQKAINNVLFSGFLVRSIDGYGFLKAMGEISFKLYADAGFYIWNHESIQIAKLDGFCMPYELKSSEQRKLPGLSSFEKIIYGYIPLMQTANCVINTTEGCQKSDNPQTAYLTDRYQKRFPVVRNCSQCINTIYNCIPLSLHNDLRKWEHIVDFRIDFSIENKSQVLQILQYFMSGAKGAPPYSEYTSGHEKRGAE